MRLVICFTVWFHVWCVQEILCSTWSGMVRSTKWPAWRTPPQCCSWKRLLQAWLVCYHSDRSSLVSRSVSGPIWYNNSTFWQTYLVTRRIVMSSFCNSLPTWLYLNSSPYFTWYALCNCKIGRLPCTNPSFLPLTLFVYFLIVIYWYNWRIESNYHCVVSNCTSAVWRLALWLVARRCWN